MAVFQIVGDAVGWGFVVRGNKPCHIQAVDPSGPAAAAGMKVISFLGHTKYRWPNVESFREFQVCAMVGFVLNFILQKDDTRPYTNSFIVLL